MDGVLMNERVDVATSTDSSNSASSGCGGGGVAMIFFDLHAFVDDNCNSFCCCC